MERERERERERVRERERERVLLTNKITDIIVGAYGATDIFIYVQAH
jgi:hypothetical protein